MSISRLRNALFLLAFLTACIVCVIGVVSTASRLNLDAKSFEKGDALLSVWNIPIESESHRLFLFRLIEAHAVEPLVIERIRERKVYRVTFDGESQQIVPVLVRDTLSLSLSVPTVKRFGGLYLLGVVVVCAVFLFAAWFVEEKSPFDDRSLPFSLAAMLIAMMIATAQARFEPHLLSVSSALHIAFLFAYTLAPAFFFRWSLNFPKPRLHSSTIEAMLFYGVMLCAVLLSLYAVAPFREAISEQSYPFFQKYQTALNFCRAFFALLVVGAVFNLARAYLHLQAEGDLRRLRWSLVGTGVGGLPFVLFSLFPLVVFDVTLVPDELTVALSLLAPAMLAIAITRYRLLDVDMLFVQSFTFLSTLLLLSMLYGVALFLLSQLFAETESYSPYLVAALATVLVLICFEPMKARVQAFANTHIFKAQFNAQRAEAQLSAEIQTATSEDDLAEILAHHFDVLLGVSSVAITYFTRDGNRLKLHAQRNFILKEPRSILFSPPDLEPQLVARQEQLEEGINYCPANESRFERWRIALAVPIASERAILGYILLGEKHSQLVFNAEEIRLLRSIASTTATTLARLRLQRDLALKSEEAQRLRELSELKSYFVSSVSHDLRTPLTSIKLFAEMLSAQIDDATAKKYLTMIQGESERLSKMVANILSFAKSEKGIEAHRFETLNLSTLAAEAVHALAYQVELGGFEVQAIFEPNLLIDGDKSLLLQAIENLLSNAMKYSGNSKQIDVRTFRDGRDAVLCVKDYGIGISEADQARLFEPFFRSPDERSKQIGGAGLGLALVKNTMNTHRGKVLVKSRVGEGSEFELHFPLKSP